MKKETATSLKKRFWHRYFPVSSAKFLRTPFYRTNPDECFQAMFLEYLSDKTWQRLENYSFRGAVVNVAL